MQIRQIFSLLILIKDTETTEDLPYIKIILLYIPYLPVLPYAGKFWRGKILANLAINANSPNFFPANTY